MFSWLKRILRKNSNFSGEEVEQTAALTKALEVPSAEIDTRCLVPIYIPVSFIALGNWPGPFVRFEAAEVALTWVILFPSEVMRYVSHSMAAAWEAKGLDWKSLADQNLLGNSEDPWTHEMRDGSDRIFAVILMHPDGLGPSRLLLREAFEAVFSDGYQVAIPEMSCGMAFSKQLDPDQKNHIEGLIKKCYESGTRPLSPSVYEPSDIQPD